MIDEKLKSDISSIAANSQELLSRCISSLDEIDKANSKAIKDIEARTNNLLKCFKNSFEVSVGVGGDFKTLREAISYYSDYRPKFGSAVPQIVIVLLNNYTLDELLSFKRCNLAHICITSKNEVINVDCSKINGDILFNFEQCSGMFFYQCNFNFINTDNNKICFNLSHNSFIYVYQTYISNAKGLIRLYTDSNCDFRKSICDNIKDIVAYLSETANFNSIENQYLNCKDCFYTLKLSRLSSFQDTFNGINLVAKVVNGATISLTNNKYTDITTKTNQAVNTITSSGIIYE